MFIDRLEARRLMAADAEPAVPFSLVTTVDSPPIVRVSKSGTLHIVGDSHDESIRVHYRPSGKVAVNVTWRVADDRAVNFAYAFKRSEIKRLRIDAAGGDDDVRVEVGDLTGASTILGGTGNDSLFTRGRNTQVFGQGGDDILTSEQGPGRVSGYFAGDVADRAGFAFSGLSIGLSRNVLDGGAGTDTLRTFGGDDTLVGGTRDDRFEPLGAGIEATELADGESLPAVPDGNGVARNASRVGLRGVEVTRPFLAGQTVYTVRGEVPLSVFKPAISVRP